MPFLRNLLFTLVFVPGSTLITVAIALVSPFSAKAIVWGSHQWSAWFVWCARVFHGVRLVIRGDIPQTGVIVALKHQSAFETFLTLFLFDWPAVVMKVELRKIPVWGYVSWRHGSIFVERDKGGAALKGMLRQARQRVDEGRPIVMFPEGTRVPVGEAPPLKAGLYAVYSALKLPVVPVALDSGRVWGKSALRQPGTVTLAFQASVPPGLPREEFEARVHAAINADPATVPL
jgi:1-acyl-sn-glycerol-3-phosphate acyltransferase